MASDTNPTLQEQVNALRNFDPVRLTHEVIEDGELWADADVAASALEETRKTVLAKRTLEFIEGSLLAGKARAMSVAQAEMNALADPTYEEHVLLMVDARKNSNRARVRYDLGRMRLELLRTAQATLRNEMRMSGYTT
jgi:predicted nicotinamide N-methyase